MPQLLYLSNRADDKRNAKEDAYDNPPHISNLRHPAAVPHRVVSLPPPPLRTAFALARPLLHCSLDRIAAASASHPESLPRSNLAAVLIAEKPSTLKDQERAGRVSRLRIDSPKPPGHAYAKCTMGIEHGLRIYEVWCRKAIALRTLR
jgi:hypothetical protein